MSANLGSLTKEENEGQTDSSTGEEVHGTLQPSSLHCLPILSKKNSQEEGLNSPMLCETVVDCMGASIPADRASEAR